MLLLATRSCAPSKKNTRKKNNLSTSFFAKAAAGQQKRPKNDSVKYELAGSGQLPTYPPVPPFPTPPAGNTVQMQFATVVHAAN